MKIALADLELNLPDAALLAKLPHQRTMFMLKAQAL